MLNLVTVPPRLILRALDDLHTIALAAARLEAVEQRLDDRMAAAIELGERIEEVMVDAIALAREIRDIGDRVASLGTDVDGRLAHVLELGGRLEAKAQAIVELGDRVDGHVTTFDRHAEAILAQTTEVEAAARDVALSGRQLADALPTLQRAVQMAEPLEGAVERLGRIVDRLPGGIRPPRTP